MVDVAELWQRVLPGLRESVTGKGIWAALNAVRPISLEDGVLFMGFHGTESELSGHLKLPQTKRLIEIKVSEGLGSPTSVRIIDGVTQADVEVTKRRDAERRKLQEAELGRLRAEMQSKSNWDQVYEQLARRFAALQNKSLPQNRARFLNEAIDLVIEARAQIDQYDDLSERNFARCLERIAQYTEAPSVVIAHLVLTRAGEL